MVYNLEDKEFVLQKTYHQSGFNQWRCTSWSPHYITTDWFKLRGQAIVDGDKKIKEYYDVLKGNKK